MKPITEDRRQELISKTQEFLGWCERYGSSRPHDLKTIAEIALASLTTEPVAGITYKGHLLHWNDPKLDEYSDPEPLYAYPPVSALRLPDKNELPGWARTHEDSLDWYEAEVRRLNGILE